VTWDELQQIHNKMETLLGAEGAYLDAIYFCPHHPDKGFEGEIPELKIDCSCRKPKPGMLLKAAEDFNIDLKASWMIGDGKNDIEAGRNAGCRTILLTEDSEKDSFGQDLSAKTLSDAVAKIEEM
jgi:D-glycero-D-manno-heptose 1,7-bisphosphate phosphatase